MREKTTKEQSENIKTNEDKEDSELYLFTDDFLGAYFIISLVLLLLWMKQGKLHLSCDLFLDSF